MRMNGKVCLGLAELVLLNLVSAQHVDVDSSS